MIALRSVAPLDVDTIVGVARAIDGVVAAEEDHLRAGLSGEIAAILAEDGVGTSFARVAVESTIPYARHLETTALPNVDRIVDAVANLA